MGGMEAVDLSSGEQGQRPGSRSNLDPGHEAQHGVAERRSGPGHSHNQSSLHTDDEDSQSNKSLDLNFASKLIDFKFSSGGGAEGQNSQSSSSSSSSSSSVAGEEPERAGQLQESEVKLSCKVCKKSFRYAATLARHERAHLCEGSEVGFSLNSSAAVTSPAEDEELEEEDEEMEGDGERGSEGGESDSEGEDKEKGERSDEEEGGASEPKNGEGDAGGGAGKADKRKKICNVCSKRFWSLQDLTRHMRSHTGTITQSRATSTQVRAFVLRLTQKPKYLRKMMHRVHIAK